MPRTRTSPSPITSTTSAASRASSTPSRVSTPASLGSRGTLLATLGFLSFASVYTNVVVSPVLVEVGREFDVSTGTAGLLVAGYGLPGIVVALLAGPLSDRRGRKRFLFWGTVAMAIATAVGAAMPSFATLLATRVLAGIGSSVIFPNSNATVGDAFPYRERGRAMSTIIGANTMATIVGVPLAGLIADSITWRASLLLVGVLGLAAALLLWRVLPETRPAAEHLRSRDLYAQIANDPSARGAIASSLLGAVFWFTWATYLVAFFQEEFALSASVASLVALTSGVGVLAGSQLGGRLGDRIGHRPVVGWSIALAGCLLLLETNLMAGLVVAALLNLLVAGASGARFATNTAMLSELAPNARGTMMAVNSSIVSVGIVLGTTAGGIIVDAAGFGALGAMSFAAGTASAFVVWRFVTERTAEMAAGEAIE
ncbi:MAG TPA: MFS transporter [Candidatus Dormibacteraeota bacterium]|jgi:multidrug resistance protein|nr:MFS transporter [Candidatus Dormibacteraeota bacterium]